MKEVVSKEALLKEDLSKEHLYKEILFLKSIDKKMIWGSERWTVSAHTAGDCLITKGQYQGYHLSTLWQDRRNIFGVDKNRADMDRFPLLIKIIDAKEDLSIQVHPDDTYAKVYENGSLGKSECWLILDCKDDASIIIGHHADSKKELENMIAENRWKELLREIRIQKGDFFQIDAGCIHAIKGGTVLLEIQQNSDITYRLYDYDRLQDGKKRELHIQKSLDCITVPFEPVRENGIEEEHTFGKYIHYVDTKYYSIDRFILKNRLEYRMKKSFACIHIIDGTGKVDGEEIKAGDDFILLGNDAVFYFEGNLDFVLSYPQNI